MTTIISASNYMVPNDTLHVEGNIPRRAKIIQVALGSDWYHLSMCIEVRFDDNVITFNNRVAGRWGEAVKEPNPFKPGEEFKVKVFYTKTNFEVTMGDGEGEKKFNFHNRSKTRFTEKIFVRHDLELTRLYVEWHKPSHDKLKLDKHTREKYTHTL
ncbi:32 kDa beta-galactoside-binding lectin lec-3-like [Engraulis encrasicolus]|uniref:32 kDa beta-galactoside-binding lectin lec-3-like n=1 Tax=Engraulis encrasicolus TaxID=184585 RepID=UPI002FD65914